MNKHPLANKYITGVFNLRPQMPKLRFLSDVDILFWCFEQQGNNSSLSYKLLTQKLLIFLLLFRAHRISTVKLFSGANMVLNSLSVTFISTKILKHYRKGKPLDKCEYRSCTNKRLYKI